MGGRVDTRVAIVTGAAKGMGREICLTLAREGSVMKVRLRSADRNDYLKKPQLH